MLVSCQCCSYQFDMEQGNCPACTAQINNDKLVQCPQCDIFFDDEKLKLHLFKDHSITEDMIIRHIVICHLCNNPVFTHNFNDHLLKYHSMDLHTFTSGKQAPTRCRICFKNCFTAQWLIDHFSCHGTRDVYECPICKALGSDKKYSFVAVPGYLHHLQNLTLHHHNESRMVYHCNHQHAAVCEGSQNQQPLPQPLLPAAQFIDNSSHFFRGHFPAMQSVATQMEQPQFRENSPFLHSRGHYSAVGTELPTATAFSGAVDSRQFHYQPVPCNEAFATTDGLRHVSQYPVHSQALLARPFSLPETGEDGMYCYASREYPPALEVSLPQDRRGKRACTRGSALFFEPPETTLPCMPSPDRGASFQTDSSSAICTYVTNAAVARAQSPIFPADNIHGDFLLPEDEL